MCSGFPGSWNDIIELVQVSKIRWRPKVGSIEATAGSERLTSFPRYYEQQLNESLLMFFFLTQSMSVRFSVACAEQLMLQNEYLHASVSSGMKYNFVFLNWIPIHKRIRT